MSLHHGSAYREDLARHNAAFVDGVCHAIDVLELVLGEREAAERLMGAVFMPVGAEEARQLGGRPTSPAGAPAAGAGYSTAPKARPEEHILP